MAENGSFRYEIRGGEVTITDYLGKEQRAEVPPAIEGYPVTVVGDYAFSKKEITHLYLPEGVRRMGRYCLYDSQDLSFLSFTDSLKDIGAGAFTGCHHIKALSVSLLKGKASLLRDVLMEVAEEVVVSLEMPEGRASLLFPAFFEEGVENTPARIIEHHTHGSGLLFRNCFVSRELQFLEYDKRFADARGEEGEELLLRLALGRLRFPLHLEKASKEAYEAYLGEHFEAALDLAARQRDTATSAFLMEWKHRGKAGRKKREDFSL